MISRYLPYFLFKPLFGDRKRWGLKLDENDPEFIRWQEECYVRFYLDNQKGRIGEVVNHFGFKIVSEVDFTGKRVLELGPGIIEHLQYAKSIPASYVLVDKNRELLEASTQVLKDFGVEQVEGILVDRAEIPVPDDSVDMVLTFHQLEHIVELESYLDEIARVLRPGGLLVGAVPAEGGLAWGLGRYLTTRRYAYRQMNLDYDKIICWEHPNFVDQIKQALDSKFEPIRSVRKPMPWLPFDGNLSWSFIYRNPA